MPIPRELFEEGIDEVDIALLKFLEDSADEAYSTVELAEAVGIDMNELPLKARFLDRLKNLDGQGRIDGKIIQGVRYYSLGKQ